MMSYEALQAYQKQLRKTIFLSADVLPEQVATYLKKIAVQGSTYAIEEALETYLPLVKHLARDYVDFALAVLLMKPLMKPEKEDPHDIIRWSSFLRTYYDNLGIRERIRCFPPAHIQGPFLYLLRCNEHEGLRLIHALANMAVGVWQQREHDFHFLGQTRTPLPVVLPLLSGPHALWGDERVYSWYCPSTNAPDIVISALMALEVWLEGQVIAGKKPGELFERVLGESDCVAVAGICLSVALAFPEQCLTAALSLISSPAIWRLDMARAAQDRRPPIYVLYHDYQLIYEARAERDQQPQRQRTLPFLAGYYVFAEDKLKTLFEQAVTQFPEHLPFLFEEERDDPAFVSSLKEWVEQIRACGDLANYRRQREDDQTQIQFDPPSSSSQKDTESSDSDEQPYWQRVALWVQQTLQEGIQAEGLTAIEAITAIREIQKKHQNLQEEGDPQVLFWLVPAVAVAALVADFQSVQEHGLIPWCYERLLTAVRQESREANFYAYPAHVSDILIIFAVKGLVMLIVRGIAAEEIREGLLHLAASPYEEVMVTILQSLDKILAVDEVLCWNALSLVLSFRLIPRQLAIQAVVKRHNTGEQSKDVMHWERQVVKTHLAALKRQVIPELPNIPVNEETCLLWDQVKLVLDALPFATMCTHPSTKARLLGLVSDLMAWTIAVNTSSPEFAYVLREPYPMRPYEWSRFFIGWAVRMMDLLSQEERRQSILAPLLEQWNTAPRLVKDLMYSYTLHYMSTLGPLSSSSVETWRFLCAWILDNAELACWADTPSLESSISEVVEDIVFAGLTHKWPHASLFRDIIDKWVRVIGRNPDAYPSLLKFLRGPGGVFVPDPALEWISRCVPLSTQKLRFWQAHRNAERTARLLRYMWDHAEEEIRSQSTMLKCYTNLVDQLVGLGVPLASVLQQELESQQ